MIASLVITGIYRIVGHTRIYYRDMSTVGNSTDFSASFQTRFYSNAIRRSDVQNGVCEIDGDSISLRAGSQSLDISLDDVTDLTLGTPPEQFDDELEQVFGIKFSPAGGSGVCFIEYDPEYADIFEYQLFAAIINGADGLAELGAQKGGQQTGTDAEQVEVAIEPDRVVFETDSVSSKTVALGEIVNIKSGKRTIGEAKRDAIKVDYMKSQTRITSYLSLIETRLQHLFNRYLRTEYAELEAEIDETDVSEAETQLVVGYYTTQNLKQTMHALTDGNTSEFESIYEDAIDHGLVTHPDDGVGLTQKGKMLANTELETVNT
jgi:helix-turn-helix protein